MLLNPDPRRRLAERTTLFGAAIATASPMLAEMAVRQGFDVIWADLEHRWINPERAEDFCRGVRAGGGIPMLRIPNTGRDAVLHALDAGASIVAAPMVESAESSREMVRWGKFPPLGERGYNGATPGMAYALGSRTETIRDANEQTWLLPQIETQAGVEHCAEIVGVDGIAGGMIGPADLSIALGMPMQFDSAEFQRVFRNVLRTIHGAGKLAAVAGGHPALTAIAIEESAEIVLCAADINGLRAYFDQSLREGQALLEKKRAAPAAAATD